MSQIDIKLLLLNFSEADYRRLFSFSSGHAGALPVQGQRLAKMLQPTSFIDFALFLATLLGTLAKLFLEIVLPIRHIEIVSRATIRKFRGTFKEKSAHRLSVFSIGATAPKNDAYFGKLLEEVQEPFNYITVVGGGATYCTENIMVETLLPARKIALLWLTLPLRTPWLCFQLIYCALRLKKAQEKLVFICFGAMEISAGRVLGQQVSVAAMHHHLHQGNVKSLLLPMEARNWEKCIVAAAKSAQVNTIGYVHCALTPRHFGLLDKRFLREAEIPDRIITPSVMSYRIIRSQYGSRAFKGYFLRGRASNPTFIQGADRYLLFALIGDVSESMKIIEAAASLLHQLKQKLVIRLNPNIASFSQLKAAAVSYGLSLYDPIAMGLPEICFFRSSSVAIEYLKQNVRPVYLSIDEPISNNIFELDNKFGISSVKIDSTFAQSVSKLIAEDHYVNGSDIANHYLDEDFVPSNLPKLIQDIKT